MYKVYYNNRLITIGSDIQAFPGKGIYRKTLGDVEMKEEWKRFKKDRVKGGLWIQGDVEKLWKEFKALFKVIEAAGGLVKNKNDEYLLIFRNKKWDLPKGKLEKKETIEEAALREVEEECGVSGLKIVKALPATYHIYELKGKDALKHSHWFAMKTEYKGSPKPQHEEGIEKAIWATPAQVKKSMENMYPSVKDLLGGYLKI